MKRSREHLAALSSDAATGSIRHHGSAAGGKTGSPTLRRLLVGKKHRVSTHIKPKDLTFILRNLAILLQNAVPLPRALGTLAKEQSLGQYAEMLDVIRRRIETGETFSNALRRYPGSFDTIMVNQIKVGERAGSMSETLDRIATQREQAGLLKATVKKKLAYPVVLLVVGTGVVIFMMTFVIPTFEETYAGAGIPLPLITQFMIAAAGIVKSYGWMVVAIAVLLAVGASRARRNARLASEMDRWLLGLPLFGNWMRDMAVLQLMEVLGNLMEAGFTLADGLGESADSVGNHAVRQSVRTLQKAVLRGERFSREIERHGDMFPPIVSQLVIVGEQTGTLATATSHIRDHLRREIERKTGALVGTIEPVLTIFLAAAIAVILLAIYLPMFDMIGTADV